ncbi:MAG: DUF4384 domain-containing protein [Candidatus Hydrothermales bacterium]
MKKLIFLTIVSFALLQARMVELWVEGGHKSVYTAGEKIKVNLISKVDGYLYLFNIDPSGKSKLIFPVGKPVYIKAGVHYVLPDDFYDDVEWFPSYEQGIEYIYAVVVPYPIYDIPDECFEPLPPHSFIYYDYDDVDFVLVFKFRPPFWFPKIYFGAWTCYYVIPRYYIYHPAPWFCYDCHYPRIFFYFYFDFCPIYEIRVYEYRYVYIPRYVKSIPERYRVRTRWEFSKEITRERKIRLQEIEKNVRLRVKEAGLVEGKEVREIIKIREKLQLPEIEDIKEVRNFEREVKTIRKIETEPSEKRRISEVKRERLKFEKERPQEKTFEDTEKIRDFERESSEKRRVPIMEEERLKFEERTFEEKRELNRSYRENSEYERQRKIEKQRPIKIPGSIEKINLKGRGVIPENRIENRRSRK